MTTKKRGVNVKEWVMFGMGCLISILGAFSAYVVNDMRADVQAINTNVEVMRDKYDSKFDNIAVTYVMKDDYERDRDKIEDKIEGLKRTVDNLKK